MSHLVMREKREEMNVQTVNTMWRRIMVFLECFVSHSGFLLGGRDEILPPPST